MVGQSKNDNCNGCDEEYGNPEVSGPFRSCFMRIDVDVRQEVSFPFKEHHCEFWWGFSSAQAQLGLSVAAARLWLGNVVLRRAARIILRLLSKIPICFF